MVMLGEVVVRDGEEKKLKRVEWSRGKVVCIYRVKCFFFFFIIVIIQNSNLQNPRHGKCRRTGDRDDILR